MLDDLVGDVCRECKHVLREDDSCSNCGWVRKRTERKLPPHEPDDLPSIGGW